MMLCICAFVVVFLLADTASPLGPGLCAKFLTGETGCNIASGGCADNNAPVGQNCSPVPYITQTSEEMWDAVAPADTVGYYVWNVNTIVCYRVAPCLAQLNAGGNRFCGPDLNNVVDFPKDRWYLDTDDPCEVPEGP